MNNKEILKKAKELVELLEKQEESDKVALSILKRGDVFQTTGKRSAPSIWACWIWVS
jgi:hypothetical protein